MNKAQVDLIVYDFDGVMTDNRVYLDQDGVESVVCTRADGLGIEMLRRAGIPQIIISTETNPVVLARARKLNLQAICGAANKQAALLEYCQTHSFDPGRVVYVGNDENDVHAMRSVGYAVCPADAHPVTKSIARLVTRAPGGAGVVRELADRLLSEVDPAPEDALKKPATLRAQIRKELQDAVQLRMTMMEDAEVTGAVESLARAMDESLAAGGKILFAGNGGSFADAQHLAAEFVGRFMRERAPLAAVCLGTNSSTVTAVGNDYRFDDIFVRELRALGSKQDVLIALSTSGNSTNLIAAIEAAQAIGMKVFALLGKGGGRIAHLVPAIVVPSDHTARIQEMHITFGHVLCGLVDSLLSERQG